MITAYITDLCDIIHFVLYIDMLFKEMLYCVRKKMDNK